MKLSIFLTFTLVASVSFSCLSQITFEKLYGGSFGDYGTTGLQTTDGGYLIGGFTRSYSAGQFDMYFIKTDRNGDTTWTRTIGGLGDDRISNVKQTFDQGFIATGIISHFVHLVKLDSSGNVLWVQNTGVYDYGSTNSVQQTNDSGYVVAGTTGSIKVYLLKTNAAGKNLWIKNYETSGQAVDRAYSVLQTNDNGFIILGTCSKHSSPITSDFDVYLIKTDEVGDTLWTKVYGGAEHDVGQNMQITTDGGFIIVGGTYSFGNDGTYLIKTDSLGTVLWSKTYSSIAWSGFDKGYSVNQTNDGGYFITSDTVSIGFPGNDIQIIKTDSVGNVLWNRSFNYPGSDAASSGQPTIDGGYVIFGRYGKMSPSGNYEMIIIKTDSMGNTACSQKNNISIADTAATQIFNRTTIVTPIPLNDALPVYNLSSGCVTTTLCTAIGTIENENTLSSLTLTPNPATTSVTITLNNTSTLQHPNTLTLYDIAGRALLQQPYTGQTQLNIANFSSGMYIVEIKDTQGNSLKQKLLKQ